MADRLRPDRSALPDWLPELTVVTRLPDPWPTATYSEVVESPTTR